MVRRASGVSEMVLSEVEKKGLYGRRRSHRQVGWGKNIEKGKERKKEWL